MRLNPRSSASVSSAEQALENLRHQWWVGFALGGFHGQSLQRVEGLLLAGLEVGVTD